MNMSICDPKQTEKSSSLGLIVLLASLCFVVVIFTKRHTPVYSADSAAVERARTFLSSPIAGRQVIEYAHYGETYAGHQYVNTLLIHDANGHRQDGFSLQYRFRWSVGGVTDLLFLCDKAGYVYDVHVLSSNARSNLPFENSKNAIEIFASDLLSSYTGQLDSADLGMIQRVTDEDDVRGMLAWRLSFEQRCQPLSGG